VDAGIGGHVVGKRLAVVIGILFAVVLGGAPNAWAHTELVGSNPAEGARLDTPPQQVELTFDEPLEPDGAVIYVDCGAGYWRPGEITADGTTLRMPVTPTGPAGPCTVNYFVTAGDGDPLTGAVTFTLTKDAPAPTTSAEPSAPPSTSDPITGEGAEDTDGVPLWVWFMMGAVVLGVVVGIFFASITRRR
jgi:methionine-rich copper-binding protein CopC